MPDPMTSGTFGGSPATTLSPPDATTAPADTTPPVSSLADQAKQKLTGAIDGQKGAAADAVEKLAETVHRAGEQFEGQQDWIASAIQRGAAELDTFAATLRDKTIGDFARQGRTFARQQPTLFMASALVAGFAVARLGKIVASDLSRDDLPSIPEVGHGQP